ncbi:unnamed protein product [Hymenolepis diminuta]|uniref:Kazal-like domain-containing protein n=1 Tax=Hymenolepis diminuta TaxID=6216 RepID=A0A0R3SIF9_HYMDI|nr:unnamed protein product [Hymenolepis diminuta]VUZ43073.1 unnamed protein product [Hymenolepis diminuta]
MFSKRQIILIALFAIIGLYAMANALEEERGKNYEERFAACEERCQVYSKEECPSRVEKCQFLVRGTIYDDCIAEEGACVDANKTDCYKNFIKCVETYAKD